MDDQASSVPSLLPWVTLLKDVVVAVTGGVAAFAAIRGLRLWRLQLAGTKDHTVAEDALIALYGLRDAVRALRSTWFEPSELPVFGEVVGQPPSEREQDRQFADAMKHRWRSFEEAHASFRTRLLRAEVRWPTEMFIPANALTNCISEITHAAHHYLAWAEDRELLVRVPVVFQAQMQAVLFAVGEENEISQRLRSAIEALEVILRSKLTGVEGA